MSIRLNYATYVADGDYDLILDGRALTELINHYSSKADFSFDTETTGDHRLDTLRNEVTWMSMACDDHTAVIPMGHPNGDLLSTEYPLLATGKKRLDVGLAPRPQDYSKDEKKVIRTFGPPPTQLLPAEVFSALGPLFFSGDALKYGHNLKFDLKTTTKYFGGTPFGPYFDTMIASWVIDSRRVGQLGLAACLNRELGIEMVKGVGAEVEAYDFVTVAKYAALDSRGAYDLGACLYRQVVDAGLLGVMNLEMHVLEAICSMELAGAKLDEKALQTLHDKLELDLEFCKARIFSIAGREFNLNSTAEKRDLLFALKRDGGRGLRPRKRTASGTPSVAADALEKYRGKDELVDGLLEFADLNKLMGTYVIPYLGGSVVRTTAGKSRVVTRESMLVNGRIHTDFVQHGAETGRFSSRNPNLQNVPNASTPHGKAIRDLFIADEGNSLVCADYSQVEPRIIASLSKDPIMWEAFTTGQDIYTAIGDPLGLERRAGKVAVLAMSYGIGPDHVEVSLKLKPGTGKAVLAGFEKQFAPVYRYKRKICAEAANRKPEPHVKTLLGRRRFLPDLRAREFGLKSRAERQAFNTLIQGTAADLMKVALVRLFLMLPDEAQMILTVHDEVLIECPDEMTEEVAAVTREAMECIHILDPEIPLIADIQIAKTWGEAK